MTDHDDRRAQERSEPETLVPAECAVEVYQSPVVVDLGSVRDLTQGSTKNGKCDATSQYYN